jgi:phage shock protein A
LTARQRAAEFRKKLDSQGAGLSADVDDSAFAKFDRMKSKVEQAEAEAEAIAELRAGSAGATPMDDVDDDVSGEDLDVAAELAEMKRKAKG